MGLDVDEVTAMEGHRSPGLPTGRIDVADAGPAGGTPAAEYADRIVAFGQAVERLRILLPTLTPGNGGLPGLASQIADALPELNHAWSVLQTVPGLPLNESQRSSVGEIRSEIARILGLQFTGDDLRGLSLPYSGPSGQEYLKDVFHSLDRALGDLDNPAARLQRALVTVNWDVESLSLSSHPDNVPKVVNDMLAHAGTLQNLVAEHPLNSGQQASIRYLRSEIARLQLQDPAVVATLEQDTALAATLNQVDAILGQLLSA
jgi:hypothetical protein